MNKYSLCLIVLLFPCSLSALTIKPDRTREKQSPEYSPLVSFSYVGEIKEKNEVFALIRNAKGELVKLQVGDYIGRENGRVKQISSDVVWVIEIVPDCLGGWYLRNNYLLANKQQGTLDSVKCREGGV